MGKNIHINKKQILEIFMLKKFFLGLTILKNSFLLLNIYADLIKSRRLKITN